jgi:hypothetical protein
MSRGKKGLGHTGIIVSVDPQTKTFTSMEGNTNDQKSGEGHRVGKNTRNINDKALIGFVDYFKNNRTKEFEDNISKNLTGKISNLAPPILDPKQSDSSPGKIGDYEKVSFNTETPKKPGQASEGIPSIYR